ncbi:quinone oxidoreductase family protein [Kordiimonas pumila]|uniref:Quinone oxidoreductase family protein n=1 Tax=Kordiimonas pumila TaxID=2161677 RepID=A0ABV7D917_9PROT|nr:quinone oxidoreductase [Kordiimonas pumila]
MTHAIVIKKTGGPDVLQWEEINVPAPKADEISIKHTFVSLNYIDTYHRSGLYPMPLPGTIGLEAVGVISAVGDTISDLKVGDRVAYPIGPLGAYAEERTMPAHTVVKIPDTVSDETVAAILMKACTVECLIKRIFHVGKDHTVLLQAAAGGVGLLACQWLSAIGATVIGTVSSEEKAILAKENGCTHTLNYKTEDFQKRVMEITDGKGVDVVYDSAGKDTFIKSLDCLKPRGWMVTYGNTTGPIDPISPALLAQKGSLILTRPTVLDYMRTREELVSATNAVFNQIEKGVLKANINQKFALKDAATAHRALEAGKTSGQTLLAV